MPKRDPSKPKRSVWDDDYRPYGVNKGAYGTPDQWKKAYDDRMDAKETAEVLNAQADSPYAILGIVEGCSWDDVKRAYRKAVFKTHPDHGGTDAAFKTVNAAYSRLAIEFGA